MSTWIFVILTGYCHIGSQQGRVFTQVRAGWLGSEGSVGEAGPSWTYMWFSPGLWTNMMLMWAFSKPGSSRLGGHEGPLWAVVLNRISWGSVLIVRLWQSSTYWIWRSRLRIQQECDKCDTIMIFHMFGCWHHNVTFLKSQFIFNFRNYCNFPKVRFSPNLYSQ